MKSIKFKNKSQFITLLIINFESNTNFYILIYLKT